MIFFYLVDFILLRACVTMICSLTMIRKFRVREPTRTRHNDSSPAERARNCIVRNMSSVALRGAKREISIGLTAMLSKVFVARKVMDSRELIVSCWDKYRIRLGFCSNYASLDICKFSTSVEARKPVDKSFYARMHTSTLCLYVVSKICEACPRVVIDTWQKRNSARNVSCKNELFFPLYV